MSKDPPAGGSEEPSGSSGLSERRRRRREGPIRLGNPPPEEDQARLLHELNVYKTELESQNDELREAQLALEVSRARYQDLYRGAPIALVTVGLQGRILTYNQRAATILQLYPSTARRHRITDFMIGEYVGLFERHRARLLNSGETVRFELQMRRSGGGLFWAEMVMNLAREEVDGSLVCQIALGDVSEQKALQDEVARLAAIVTSAEQAILSEDLEGRITSWNASAERLFGYTAAEAIGHNIDMLIPPERREEERQVRNRTRARTTHSREATRVRRGGELVPVFMATAPILDVKGQVVGVSHIVQDITAQVEGRQEVARLLRDLREADRRKDTFIATLAHELRNPLAPIRNAAAVLRFAPDLDPKVEWCRDVIDRQVRHMGALLEDLLDVSRLTRDMITLRRDRVELGTVIVQAVETTRPFIEGRGHKLVLQLPPDPVEVDGDLNRLVQIFGNLLSNAAKYTNPGGEIRVSAEERDEEIVVSVKDNGIGISPTNITRIFELFSQIDPGGEASEGGLGIGLALVKGLVEKHGGTVAARSEGLGKGSEFVVTLPLGTAPPRTGDSRDSSARQVTNGSEHGLRVLVVDDNVDAAESMAIILRIDGYDVRTAHDGERAMELAQDYRPHVILLDLGMPKLNGYEVARRLRQETWGREIVLVACTGWGQPDDRRRSKVAGFDHHLVKPVSPEAILKLVGSIEAPKEG